MHMGALIVNANVRLNISGAWVPKAALQPFGTLHNTYWTCPVQINEFLTVFDFEKIN